jgi:hypothetical protein
MMQPAPKWFRVAISEGLIRLVALSLPNTPSHETIELTKEAWIAALYEGRVWVEPDAVRIGVAFRALSRKVDRWPAPRMLLDHLPARPELPKLAEQGPSKDVLEANKRRVREMLRGAIKGMKA